MKQLLFLTIFSLSFGLLAQTKSEIGIHVGESYYIGDLNQTHFKDLRLSGGLHYRAHMNKRIALRASALWSRIYSNDAEASNLNQINRNLNFKSNIIEIGGMMEVNFFEYIAGDFKKYPPYTPYVFFGLAYFHHNPLGAYKDDYVELQPLGTEGQETSYNSNNKYKLNQISIPFGLGIKASLTKKICISLEYGIRKTFTDYLDDVSGTYADPTILANENGMLAAEMGDRSLNQEGISATNTGVQRGNPYNKDWFAYTSFTLAFLITDTGVCETNFRKKRYD